MNFVILRGFPVKKILQIFKTHGRRSLLFYCSCIIARQAFHIIFPSVPAPQCTWSSVAVAQFCGSTLPSIDLIDDSDRLISFPHQHVHGSTWRGRPCTGPFSLSRVPDRLFGCCQRKTHCQHEETHPLVRKENHVRDTPLFMTLTIISLCCSQEIWIHQS
jgi:hypothetical protein